MPYTLVIYMYKKTVKEEIVVLICDPVRPSTATTMNPITKINVNQKIELFWKVIKIQADTHTQLFRQGIQPHKNTSCSSRHDVYSTH